MNDKVTATGMSVKAKSDNVFLQISETSTFSGAATQVDFKESSATTIKPATPVMATNNESITKWQYATSTDPANATVGAVLQDIATDNLSQHVYSKTLYFQLAKNSTATASNLVIDSVSMTGATAEVNLNKALRVAAAGEDGVQVWTNTSGTWAKNESLSDTAIVDSLSSSKVESATLYIWFEGTDEECTTVNAATLDTLNFTVTFKVTPNTEG